MVELEDTFGDFGVEDGGRIEFTIRKMRRFYAKYADQMDAVERMLHEQQPWLISQRAELSINRYL